MTDDERARGVITASAGNHAQAVAYHASKRGIRVQICMPVLTPLVKVTATRGYGAEVILHGNNFDEAVDEARRRCDAEGLVFLHAFNDDAVIAGQGTIGLELLEQVPDLEAVVVPVGGGGLIGGIACAIKEQRPQVRMVGVETARVPSMQAALLQHHPVLVPAGVDHRRRHRSAAGGRADVSSVRKIRGRNCHRGRGRDRDGDSLAARKREDAGGGRGRGGHGRDADEENFARAARKWSC